MGSRKTNFYVDLAHRFGFGDAADEVQSLYQDGKREEAFNAIPDEMVAATSLIGTEDEVAERLERFAATGVDRILVTPVQPDLTERLHTIKRLAALRGALAPAVTEPPERRGATAHVGRRPARLTPFSP